MTAKIDHNEIVKMTRETAAQVLKESNVKVISPNELLYQHTNHIKQLEKALAMAEERLSFAEQVSREAVTFMKSASFKEDLATSQKALAESQKTNEETYKLQKFLYYLMERLAKAGLLTVDKEVKGIDCTPPKGTKK